MEQRSILFWIEPVEATEEIDPEHCDECGEICVGTGHLKICALVEGDDPDNCIYYQICRTCKSSFLSEGGAQSHHPSEERFVEAEIFADSGILGIFAENRSKYFN